MLSQKSNDVSIENMIIDINNVISKHFHSIFNKCNNDREEFENFLSNLTMVKKIIQENTNLRKKNEELNSQNKFLTNNISSLSKKYNELFFKQNPIKCSVKIFGGEVEKKNNISSGNIELVIEDSKCNNDNIDTSSLNEETINSMLISWLENNI